jgi:PAS domain S-box-containing protein
MLKTEDKTKKQLLNELEELRRQIDGMKTFAASRKNAEEAFRKNEEKYRTIYEKSAVGIFECTSKGKLVSVNPALARMFGYDSPHEAVTLLTADTGPFHRYEAVKESIQNRGGGRFEIPYTRKDGTQFTGSTNIQSIHDREGRLLYFYGLIEDITTRKLREDEARHFSRTIISVMEDERKKISRDLHDELGQNLTALHLMSESIYALLPEDSVEPRQRCNELTKMLEQMADTIRDISSRMRPDMLDDLGLVPAMEWYVKDFAKRKPGLDVEFIPYYLNENMGSEVKTALYRITQEGLNNIVKHSKAKNVSIILAYKKPNILLTIADDGIGFGQTISDFLELSGLWKKGIGLLSIQERVASLGGKVYIRSNRGEGTTIKVEIELLQGEESEKYQGSYS